MNLEIGGQRVKTEWSEDWHVMDCIDDDNIDIIHDLSEFPYPIEDDTYNVVYMSHVLEHLSWVITPKILEEIYRIIKPGGSVEIHVPDLKKLVDAYLNPELIKENNAGWYPHNPKEEPIKWFNGRMFNYGPGNENFHRAAFDEAFLKQSLSEVGFKDLEIIEHSRGSYHGWINLGIKGIK